MVEQEKKYTCINPKCKNSFEKPKLVHYYACSFCSTKIEEESDENGCHHYFGYFKERESGEIIPSECIECRKNVECMVTT